MYKKIKPPTGTLRVNESTEGESIEEKVRRIINNAEGIEDGAPIIFTERSEGVRPEYDIRTDRFELAVDASDKLAKERLAKREERQKSRKEGGDTATPGESKPTPPDAPTS